MGGVNPAHSNGFTLAEVLITLGIIGVVSALTLPTLIKNYQKQQTVNQLKASYSIISQAIRASEADNGSIDTWDIDGFWETGPEAYDVGKEFSEKYLLPYLKVAKKCTYRSKECFEDYALFLDGSRYYSLSGNGNYKYNFVLSNGTVVAVHPRILFVEIYMDLNGKKKPNRLGTDIFLLVLNNTGKSGSWGRVTKPELHFWGQGFPRATLLKADYFNCAKSGSWAGLYCGALIMLDGWKIKDDYPW